MKEFIISNAEILLLIVVAIFPYLKYYGNKEREQKQKGI